VMRFILYCAIASAAVTIFASWRAEAAQPDCYEVAQRIVGAGLQLKRTTHSEMFDAMEFDDLLKSEVSVKCDKSGADVSLGYDGHAEPSPLWLGEAATVGSATTGASKSEVTLAVRLCLQRALASKGEIGEALTPLIKVDCQAFTRDGGAGTVDIYVPTKEERQ
jgi:hypothetical protein